MGAVNPVTLDIGSNDVLSDFNTATCSPVGDPAGDLARMDANLTGTILPRLLDAMKAPKGVAPTDFLMLNYYNPYAKICPNSTSFAHQAQRSSRGRRAAISHPHRGCLHRVWR